MNKNRNPEMSYQAAHESRKEKKMDRPRYFASLLGMMLCSALLEYTTCGQPSVSVGVTVPVPSVAVVLPSVEIHVESDFYEPLTPHGEWVVIGSYGRCWRPGHVARDWRPYCNGSWQRTDAGWYWVSDEPWAWATYHYGRWDFVDDYGWYWVPQIQWAPAWVSWHEGGGYVGWAPLQPSVRIAAGGFVGFNAALISPRAFVFVEQRHFLEPVRSTTVVANNTTIINKTTTISNTRIVNNNVINEGPATVVIEKASGRKIQAVQVQELRRTTEAAVASKPRTPNTTAEKQVQAPAPSRVQGRETKTAPAPVASPVARPGVPAREIATPATKNHEALQERNKPAPSAREFKPEPTPPAVKTQPQEPKADRPVERPEKPVQPLIKKGQQPPAEKSPAGEKGGNNGAGKDHEKKPKE